MSRNIRIINTLRRRHVLPDNKIWLNLGKKWLTCFVSPSDKIPTAAINWFGRLWHVIFEWLKIWMPTPENESYTPLPLIGIPKKFSIFEHRVDESLALFQAYREYTTSALLQPFGSRLFPESTFYFIVLALTRHWWRHLLHFARLFTPDTNGRDEIEPHSGEVLPWTYWTLCRDCDGIVERPRIFCNSSEK